MVEQFIDNMLVNRANAKPMPMVMLKLEAHTEQQLFRATLPQLTPCQNSLGELGYQDGVVVCSKRNESNAMP